VDVPNAVEEQGTRFYLGELDGPLEPTAPHLSGMKRGNGAADAKASGLAVREGGKGGKPPAFDPVCTGNAGSRVWHNQLNTRRGQATV